MDVKNTDGLRRAICAHAKKYPLMRPCDAVKLVFQSVYGGGHLCADRDECLRRIREEWERTDADENVPLTVSLGGDAVRFDFRSSLRDAFTPEQVFCAFVSSFEAEWGSEDDFEKGLGVLLDCAGEGVFGFSRIELEEYIAEYRAAGCPPVSHSVAYRETYRPAYRVMKAEYLK